MLRNGLYLAAGDLDGVTVADFFAGDQADGTGMRVTDKDEDGDSRADLMTAVGRRVSSHLGKPLTGGATPAFAFDPLADSPAGVFVG